MDRLVFNYRNDINQKSHTFASSIPHPVNNLSLLYFKTNIIEQAQTGGFTTISSIPIPKEREDAIKYEPIRSNWYTLKNMEVREIDFILTDERNESLNYTGGNINVSLTFRTNTCSHEYSQ